MEFVSRIPVLALCLWVLATASSRAGEVSTEVDQEPSAVSSLVSECGNGSDLAPVSEPNPILGGSREGTVLWQRHFIDAIYTSTGISEPASLVLAGTEFNPPMHVEATPLLGDGTADWTYGGTKLYVAASRDGDVLAAVDFRASDSTAIIREWRPDSAAPLWSYAVHPCRSLVYQGWASRKPIQVSDDGSTIAAAIVMYTPAGQRGRLFVFDAGNGTPAVDFDFPTGNVVATAITTHGEYIAMAGWPNVYVYDRYGQSLRWSGSIYSGNDALAISGDGRYLAWGWSTFYLREWNGSTYAQLWTHNPGAGYYAGQCALAEDGSALAIAWDNGSSFPNEISLDLYELPSLSLLWEYEYQSSLRDASPPLASPGGDSPREHVDIPSGMLFSPDGERLVVASWGGTFPEIHVFERSAPEPLFTLDTSGSIFDVDIVTACRGSSYVAACGKNVHAGQGGRGGDLYAIEIPGEATGFGEAAVALSFGLGANYPNPFNPRTRITYSLASAGPVRLTIYDPRGRIVRSLVEGYEREGRQAVLWDGRNDAGAQLSSGLYFVRLESFGEASSGKILLIQ